MSVYSRMVRDRNRSTRIERFNDYILVSEEVDRPVTASDFKEHHKLDGDHTESDTYIDSLIDTATYLAELFTRREIIDKVYRAYLPYFIPEVQIRRSPVKSINSISFLKQDDTWEVVDPSIYLLTESSQYPTITTQYNKQWPSTISYKMQSVKVEFSAGMNNIYPPALKLAILQHVSVLYNQRGDWGSADINSSELIGTLPSASKVVYAKMRIINR